MKLKQIAGLTNATVVCGSEYLEREVDKAFSSDLMSDVLTLDSDQLLLITGLCNLQTVRTAEMADIRIILFVRNKKTTPEMVSLARENRMAILETPFSLYRASGVLYEGGLKPVY